MDYKYLGSTGLMLSSVGFGTQTFGWNIFGKDAHRLLDIYVDAGGNYLDTADSYNEGESEKTLGAWLKGRTDHQDLVIGTKSYFPTGNGPNRRGQSRIHIFHSVEESLRRLSVDAIDLYQYHCYDGAICLEETLLTMESLIQAGKIRYFGISNYTPSTMMKMIMMQRQAGRHPIASIQLEYSLLVRSPEWDLLPVCVNEGVGVITWSPLGGGWLTGKYKRNQAPPENSRVGRKDRWDDQEEQRGGDRTWRIIDTLQTVSEKRGVPMSQVALNWLRKKKGVTTVLMGARTSEQLETNLGCAGWDMDDEEEAILDEASAVPTPSPYNFIRRYSRTTDGGVSSSG
jgi:aryl-alcohol dehydrogenase-like predicted oxidoreductase